MAVLAMGGLVVAPGMRLQRVTDLGPLALVLPPSPVRNLVSHWPQSGKDRIEVKSSYAGALRSGKIFAAILRDPETEMQRIGSFRRWKLFL